MAENSGDDLWFRAVQPAQHALGEPVARLGALGQPREDRRVWLARTGSGQHVVLKVSTHGFAAERARWAATALPVLAERGYPAPRLIWHGPVDERWYLVVQAKLPGRPLATLPGPVLDRLLALIDQQAGLSGSIGGWDISWWLGVVLFEGWEGWWDRADEAAPRVARRLRAFLGPAWGHRLPSDDVVHHDMGLGNVLTRGDGITGVVDWDHAGAGSRAIDLAGILFDWHRLRLARADAVTPDGGHRLTSRISAIAGEAGLRCVITYAAIARLALAARSCRRPEVRMWGQVIRAILEQTSRDAVGGGSRASEPADGTGTPR